MALTVSYESYLLDSGLLVGVSSVAGVVSSFAHCFIVVCCFVLRSVHSAEDVRAGPGYIQRRSPRGVTIGPAYIPTVCNPTVLHTVGF